MRILAVLVGLIVIAGMVSATGVGTHIDIDADLEAGSSLDTSFHVPGGDVDIDARGYSGWSYQAGKLASRHTFHGEGDFSGSFSTNSRETNLHKTHGYLSSYVNVESNSLAWFHLYGMQDFDVSSGNHNKNTVGEIEAYAFGSDKAEMNLKLTGSMYIYKDATNPWNKNPVYGEGSDYDVYHLTRTTDKGADGQFGTGDDSIIGFGITEFWRDTSTHGTGTGSATFSYSNIWAHYTDEDGNMDIPGGGSASMTATATGTGDYYQKGYGRNNLVYNGFSMPGGGSMTTMGTFYGGFSGNPSIHAN